MPNADSFELMLVFTKPSQASSLPCLYTTSLGSQYLIVFDTTRSPFSSWQSFPSGNHQHFGNHILTLATNNLLATIALPRQPSSSLGNHPPWQPPTYLGTSPPPMVTIALPWQPSASWQASPSLGNRLHPFVKETLVRQVIKEI